MSEYKKGIQSDKYFQERLIETINFQQSIEYFDHDEEESEDSPYDLLNDLKLIVKKLPLTMNSTDLITINDITKQIKAKYLPDDLVEEIVRTLPQTTNLQTNSFSFELLSHITQSKQKALIVSNLNYMQDLNYEHFSNLPHETAKHISYIVIRLIDVFGENLEIFYNSFFPYFLNYITSNTFYTSNYIGIHLELCNRFVKICSPEELLKIFETFKLYCNRTTNDCLIPSLHGITFCFAQDPDLVYQIKDFIDQIIYLSTRTCIENTIDSQEVRSSAFVIFEFILVQNGIKCESKVYQSIASVIHKYLDPQEKRTCSEAIRLLGYAVSNSCFIRFSNYQEIVETFLSIFNDLSVEDQKSWITTLGNIIYYLPFIFIESLFMRKEFIELLDDCFVYNNPIIQTRLLIATHNILQSSSKVVEFILNECNYLVDTINSLKESEDSEFIGLVDVVLAIFDKISRS